MPPRGFKYKLTSALSVVLVCLISQGLIARQTRSAVPLAQKDCGDSILKMKCAYPQSDEYQYVPECCTERMQEIAFDSERRPLPSNLALAVDGCVDRLGKEPYHWLHHYCAGINRLTRYKRSLTNGLGSYSSMLEKQQKQKETLIAAIKEFGMIEKVYLGAHSPLYTNIILNYAKALNLLGRKTEAFSKLNDGIVAEPANELFYLYLAQILLDSGNKNKATQILELGYGRTKGSAKIADMLSRLK
jgi:hypothetical protein